MRATGSRRLGAALVGLTAMSLLLITIGTARPAAAAGGNAEIASAAGCALGALGFEAPGWLAGLPGSPSADIDTNCHYTDTEIVIIVIGFILGVLPGILFLFLFC